MPMRGCARRARAGDMGRGGGWGRARARVRRSSRPGLGSVRALGRGKERLRRARDMGCAAGPPMPSKPEGGAGKVGHARGKRLGRPRGGAQAAEHGEKLGRARSWA
jgi:hypothetical protein